MQQAFKPLKMVRIDTERIIGNFNGAQPAEGAAYDVPIILSDKPSEDWNRAFSEALYGYHARIYGSKAGIEGRSIIVQRTNLVEVRTRIMPVLQQAVDAANTAEVRRDGELRNAANAQAAQRAQFQRAVNEEAARFNFD
jgi:hypothetical protein